MKTNSSRGGYWSLGGLGLALGIWPATALTFVSQTVNQVVPDGDASGLLSSATVSGMSGTISGLQVTLNLAGSGVDGGFNGDLYAYLRRPDGGFAVLLNRPGRRPGAEAGYGDSGLHVTFDESAAADIHNYRLTLNGNHTTPLAGDLTGHWQTDGRSVDPESTLDYSGAARTATLASFDGLGLNGTWDLHVFDLASGGEVTLESWALQLSMVPEPRMTAVVCGFGLVAYGWYRRRAVRFGSR